MEIYGIDVLPDLISALSDPVLEEVAGWQNRPFGCRLSARLLPRDPGQNWRRNCDKAVPFFAFPESVCRIIYTTNAIEALN